jgi:hypothetical protein
MTSETFERAINGQKLSPADLLNIAESNSVIYFATLPYKLQDASVTKTFVEEATIKGKRYDLIK